MRPTVSIQTTILLLLAQSVAQLQAGDASEPWPPDGASVWDREVATGDWGGLRRTFLKHGVVFNFTYAADPMTVAAGGLRRGAFYNGLLDLGTDIDAEKLLGWKGGHLHANALYPHGENGSASRVGDLGTFSNIEAYDTYRLYELWVEQSLFDDHFSLRAGQITFDSEFAVLDAYGGLFVQSGFGAPGAISANLPIPIYPNAAPGIRIRLGPFHGLAFQAAIFDGNSAPGLTPDPSPNAAPSTEFNRHGTHWELRPEQGSLWVGELSYRFNQVPEEELSPTRTTADSRALGRFTIPVASERGLAGSYEAGFLHHTDKFADLYDVTLANLGSTLAPSVARDRGANTAFYINLEQELWRETDSATQGLGTFAHLVWMPPSQNLVGFSIEGGLHYQGLIPGRDRDSIGLGAAHLRISDRVGAAVDDTNRRDGTFHSRPEWETTVEIVYRYRGAPWLWIQPHVQYVIRPGGTTDHANALIIGVRTNISF